MALLTAGPVFSFKRLAWLANYAFETNFFTVQNPVQTHWQPLVHPVHQSNTVSLLTDLQASPSQKHEDLPDDDPTDTPTDSR